MNDNKRKLKNCQAFILGLLHEKPIVFNAGLARRVGSIKATIMLLQLLYWQGKGSNPKYVYKTIKEMEYETALTRHEQTSAIAQLKRLGLLEVKLKRIPATRHFRVNIDCVVDLILSNPENSRTGIRKSDLGNVESQKTITENTQVLPKSENTKKPRRLSEYDRQQRIRAIKNRSTIITRKMSIKKRPVKRRES